MFVLIILAAAEKQHQTPVTPAGNKRPKFNDEILTGLIREKYNTYACKLLLLAMQKNKPSKGKENKHSKNDRKKKLPSADFAEDLDLRGSHRPFFAASATQAGSSSYILSFFARDINVSDLRLQTNCHHAPLIDLCCDVQLTRPA